MKKTGFLKLHAVRIGLGFAIVLLLLLNAAGVIPLGFAQRLENYTYDQRLQWTMPGTVDPRIVIVDIDEKSLREQGHRLRRQPGGFATGSRQRTGTAPLPF
jgi:CHASE2 domain-containing sensor protein